MNGEKDKKGMFGDIVRKTWQYDIVFNYKLSKLTFMLGILAAVASFMLIANYKVSGILDQVFWPAYAIFVVAIWLYIRAARMEWRARAARFRNLP